MIPGMIPGMISEMTPALDWLHRIDYLSALDLHFARTMGRLAAEDDPRVLLAAALASRFTSRGHVCVDLHRMAGNPVQPPEGQADGKRRWPDPAQWLDAVAASPLVSRQDRPAPLVLDDDGRLYLTRYWQYQQRLVASLRQRAAAPAGAVDSAVLMQGLKRMFPPAAGADGPDLQRVAAAMSVNRRLAVISGGPGTGKTVTAVKILALIIEQALNAGNDPPVIALTAPTGKAAARLKEAILAAKSYAGVAALSCPQQVKDLIPEEAATLHRTLGVSGSDPTRFRHDSQNPLPIDVLVVDECSMVDLALMAKLAAAVSPGARLVLLGDKDQLASVEAGAVFGDICRAGLEAARQPADAADIGRCIVHLTHSYRFGAESGIGALTRAVNQGDADAVMEVLKDDRLPEASLRRVDDPQRLGTEIDPYVRRHYVGLLTAQDPGRGMKLLDAFRILCAHRIGPFGAETVNRIAAGLLRPNAAGAASDWYAGRPVMVTANDYQLGLFNGDVGLTIPSAGDPQRLHVYFADSGRAVRRLAPSRLPAHQDVYAMTVHKAQGSEFDQVVVILPNRRTPVITRELLYTAVSRAKKSVTILGSPRVVCEAVGSPVQRASGLSRQLKR